MSAIERGSAQGRSTLFATLAGGLVALLCAAAPAAAQPEVAGAGYLTDTQQADGSWQSPAVRSDHATTAALDALQAIALAPAARSAAADFLELQPVTDTDALARRALALAAEGRDVAPLIDLLLGDADPGGGWGLTPQFVADPLDTSLALGPLASTAAADAVVVPALSALLAAQAPDGGWPCVTGGDSEIFCTSQAILTLARYRGRFYLAPRLDVASAFLLARLNPDGSFGPAGANQIIHSALAALALAAIPAINTQIPALESFLLSTQQADGSWQDDPYATALAVRALAALATVPFCGDDAIDTALEECDGFDLGGLTCGDLGLGTGVLACDATCRLDTTGCSGPPVCGDGEINRADEACDGADFGGATCESLGLGPGTLACTASCTFDTNGCAEPPTCGDGVINQTSESCDGGDLGGATCTDVGFLGGTLGCNPDCTFDASACEGVPFCGDGAINRSEEECDGADLGGLTCEGLGLGGGTLACSSSCTIQTAGCLESGAVDPRQIELEPASPVCAGGAETVPVSITFPPGSVVDKVDVFLLFDDTGSFAGRVPSVTGIFSQLVSQLQTALPDISFGFGVGRFEDYGGTLGRTFSGEYTTGRPFTLNQPIVTPEVPGFLSLINGALSRSAPGYGGDGPESNVEGLYQAATGLGFDGNGDGSTLDSGLAGAVATQVTPGSSGDVPAFASNVAPTSGTLGGVGFRPGALHLVIQAGDICPISAYAYEAGSSIPVTITGAGGATVPTSALRCANSGSRHGYVSNSLSVSGNTVPSAVAPRGAATIPDTVAALNDLGISVIGLAPGGVAIRNPVGPSTAPSVFLSGMALLTGAIDETGLPLVFNISGGSGPIRDAIVQAVTTAATRPVDVTLAATGLPDGLSFSFTPPVVEDVGPGGTAAFDVTFSGDGSVVAGDFGISFVDVVSNATLGTIPATAACQPLVDVPPDDDGDGFPADEDCDDTDPNVNPGADEIPGNGVDDDCNPGTPDEIPQTAAACTLTADQVTYLPTETATLDARVRNLDALYSLIGLEASLEVEDAGGTVAFSETRSLAPLPPSSVADQSFGFGVQESSPGEYQAVMHVVSGGHVLATCAATFTVESTALTGAGLVGTLDVSPHVVDAGDPSGAFYTVTNQGNDTLSDLALAVRLVDLDSGQIVGELTDTTTLAAGASYSADQTLLTDGLSPKSYLAVLIATLSGSGVEQTLDSDYLTVVNVPPDCRGAAPDPPELWPPDHSFVPIDVVGVTDADGDPITLTVLSIFQDEPTDSLGDGSSCPDATGTGSPTASLRSERAGQGDGRVYHLRFVADDGRGGTCEGEVTVCVPHDQGRGATCVDQGPLFDSMVCR